MKFANIARQTDDVKNIFLILIVLVDTKSSCQCISIAPEFSNVKVAAASGCQGFICGEWQSFNW